MGNSILLGWFIARSWEPLAIIITVDETLLQHLGEDDLSLFNWGTLCLQLCVLLLEPRDEVELLLDCMLLGEGLELVVLDLLLGASSFATYFHQVSSCPSRL